MNRSIKIGCLLLLIASLFLVACQAKTEQNTEIIEATEEQIASQSEPEVDMTKMLLPLENSEKRKEPITHVMIHFTSNVVAKPVKRNRKHVLGHDEYAPGRKTDPGELFDWERLNY